MAAPFGRLRTPRCAVSAAVGCVAVAMGLLPSVAQAEAVNHPFRFEISAFEPEFRKTEILEGPCGLALDSQGDIYVADYYHDQVVAFSPGDFSVPRKVGAGYINRTVAEDPLDGPCALAVDAAGNLYVNNFHRNVVRFAPSQFPPGSFPPNSLTSGPGTVVDPNHATGLALDPASGNVFVDERTHIAEYSPAGALIAEVATGGTLQDGYGLAVSGFPATEGFLYAADAATGTVKVFDPAREPAEQLIGEIDGAGTPQGGFASLLDAALAVDDSDGHVFVTDDLQSLDYEHPRAALDEFNPAGDYRGQLPSFPTLFASEPSGLAIDNSGTATQGNVYVTSGNSEKASVYAYGPTGPARSLTVTKSGAGSGAVRSEPAGIDCGTACLAEYSAGAEVALTASAAPGSAFAGWTGACAGSGACKVTMSEARSVGAEFEALPPQAFGAEAPAPLSAAEASAAPIASAGLLAPQAPRPHLERPHHRRAHHKGRGLQVKRGSH